MISDCDQRRSSIKSLRSGSLVSSLFESATSIIHPLEPGIEIVEFDSLGTTEGHTLFDSAQLSNAYRYTSTSSTVPTYNTAVTNNNYVATVTPADTSCISEESNRR